MDYYAKKEQIRNEAIEFQLNMAETNVSWEECAKASAYFEKHAKAYGLVKEFKENGIL